MGANGCYNARVVSCRDAAALEADLAILDLPSDFLRHLPSLCKVRPRAVVPQNLTLHIAAADCSTWAGDYLDLSAFKQQAYTNAQTERVYDIMSSPASTTLDLLSIEAEFSFPFQLSLTDDCDK